MDDDVDVVDDNDVNVSNVQRLIIRPRSKPFLNLYLTANNNQIVFFIKCFVLFKKKTARSIFH